MYFRFIIYAYQADDSENMFVIEDGKIVGVRVGGADPVYPFNGGIDPQDIYDTLVACGVTPDSLDPDDLMAAIRKIPNAIATGNYEIRYKPHIHAECGCRELPCHVRQTFDGHNLVCSHSACGGTWTNTGAPGAYPSVWEYDHTYWSCHKVEGDPDLNQPYIYIP